jgi:hypothetical protein
MKKNTALILFAVCLNLSPSLCQQVRRSDDHILFRGVVIGSSGQIRLAYSNIFINRSFSAVTGEDGTFSFYAHKNDTVIFSNLGYKSFSFIVPDTLKAAECLTGIYLKSDTLEIGEVVIIPRPANLKADMLKPVIGSNTKLDNAKANVSIAAFQGRTGQNQLGDPNTNYVILRERQKTEAYEKGGIPSDKMVSLSPLLLIPAAYLLLRGLPEVPAPPRYGISNKELEELNKMYLEILMERSQRIP